MKAFIFTVFTCILLIACNTSKNKSVTNENIAIKENDTINISNPELEYEIIIIEPGFGLWLKTKAKPKGFYSQAFLESKNAHFVNAWNARVLDPGKFNPNLYEMEINYSQGVDYGYDVNYQLYNYFMYFQLKYNEQLISFIPRN